MTQLKIGDRIPIGMDIEKERAMLRRIANSEAVLDIYDRTTGANDVFYDLMDNTNDYSIGLMDATKTKFLAPVSAGVTDLKPLVENPIGFKTGQEITIQDDVNMERVFVTRGEVVSESTVIDKTTPTTVVGSAYTTSASARPQRLSNGWWVFAVYDSGNYQIKFYVSKDDFATTPTQLCYITVSNNYVGTSIAVKGTRVYVICTISNGTTLPYATFDATTVTNIALTTTNLDTAQTAFSGCSIAINSTGTELIACWSSKNATYPNSFNIRCSKGTINADGSVAWGSILQLSAMNTTAAYVQNPCVIIVNGYTYIFVEYSNGSSTRAILCITDKTTNKGTGISGDSAWGNTSVNSNASSYSQSVPSATVDSNGVIHVVWSGLSAEQSSARNIFYSSSSDNASTWSAAIKLTTSTYHQDNASITIDKNNDVHVVFHGVDQISSNTWNNIRYIKKTGNTWGSVVSLTTNTTNNAWCASICDNYRDFEKPITVWQDISSPSVKFYGKYTVISQVPYLQTQPLTKSYKKNAIVYRSNVDVDIDNKKIGIGNYIGEVVIDKTASITIDSNTYTLSANARPQRLSNGWFVICGHSSTDNQLHIFVSKDNGVKWDRLTKSNNSVTSAGFSIVSFGTTIHLIWLFGTANIYYYKFDAVNVGNTIDWVYNIETNQTAFNGCSLAINSIGTELTACWASKNTTYPNAYNIRTTIGTISANGNVTWSNVAFVTEVNTSGYDWTLPSVTYNKLDKPVILMVYGRTSFRGIYASVFNGTTWTTTGGITVYNAGNFVQTLPSVTTQKYGTNAGRIWVAWHGTDNVESSANNIRVAYSDDNGSNWTVMEKLTNGNTYAMAKPSITVNKNGDVFVIFVGVDTSINTSYDQIKKLKYSNNVWGERTTLTNNASSHSTYPSTCDNFSEFDEPITIWVNANPSATKFYGKWIGNAPIPLLESDVRYNIDASDLPSNEMVAWIEHNKNADMTITPSMSIVDTAAIESYVSMTATMRDVDEVKSECELLGAVDTPNEKITLKLNVNRTSTNIPIELTKLLGAIGEA